MSAATVMCLTEVPVSGCPPGSLHTLQTIHYHQKRGMKTKRRGGGHLSHGPMVEMLNQPPVITKLHHRKEVRWRCGEEYMLPVSELELHRTWF